MRKIEITLALIFVVLALYSLRHYNQYLYPVLSGVLGAYLVPCFVDEYQKNNK